MSQQIQGPQAGTAARPDALSADLINVLEERVAHLVERYREGRRTVQELRGLLKEREKRIGELNDKVYALARLRTDARKHVDRLIHEIERIERQQARAKDGRSKASKG